MAIELPIRDPAVADQHAAEIGPEQLRDFGEAALRRNGVHGRVERHGDAQLSRMPADFPAGFIGTDDRTAADGRAETALRCDLGGRRAERVRGLQRMPTLHAAVCTPCSGR